MPKKFTFRPLLDLSVNDFVDTFPFPDPADLDFPSARRRVTLAEAGLEERESMPLFGLMDTTNHPGGTAAHGVAEYARWFYDGDLSAIY